MQSALDQFHISINRVRDLIAVHNFVKAKSTSVLDLSDMLRAALVLAVSALYHVRLNTYALEEGRQLCWRQKAEGKKRFKGIKFFYN
ncbi:MAG: hypothetical protein F6K17_07145 [Okeania sp. SIO3C4]|nr:hypothetical protein [Okeania sp. SIO3C4]